MEEIEIYLETAEEMMQKSIDHTKAEFAKIRAGKAMPSMVDGINVEYYGSMTPLNQVAGVTTPDARTISIKPWEKSMLQEIERAIINSDLGFNPQSDGEQIRINIPPLTEERRAEAANPRSQEARKLTSHSHSTHVTNKPRSREAEKPRSQEAEKPRSQEAEKPGSQEAAKPTSWEAEKLGSREAGSH